MLLFADEQSDGPQNIAAFSGIGGQQELVDADDCFGDECQNGATCVPKEPFGFDCICADGFKGYLAFLKPNLKKKKTNIISSKR